MRDKHLLALTLGAALAGVTARAARDSDDTPTLPSKPPTKGDTPANKPVRKFTDARKAEKARRKNR